MARRAAHLDLGALMAVLHLDPSDRDDEATTAMLDATSTLLSTYGMRRWSMDDVAERSGLARATVYRRFEGREELVTATLARDARRFFAAIAEAVDNVEALDDKVVEGFLVALQACRRSPLPTLLSNDTSAAFSLLTEGALAVLGRAALVDRYETMTGRRLLGSERAEAELVAEALVRLGISFILMPQSIIDLDDTDGARRALGRLVKPLLANAPEARRRPG